jgi:catechol 2,3-dioxygenase
MEVRELGHAVLYVHSIERSSHFYREVLGWNQISPVDPTIGVAAFNSPSQRTHHELLLIEVGEAAKDLPPGRRVGLYHLGIRIGNSDDELRAALAQLKEAGVAIVGMSDHTVSHSLYIEDPDGNELELYVDVPGVDWRKDPMVALAGIRPLHL